jgi:hypothetical protein
MADDDAEKTRDSGRDVPRFSHPHRVHTSASFVHRSAGAPAPAGHSSHPPGGVWAGNTVYCMVGSVHGFENGSEETDIYI